MRQVYTMGLSLVLVCFTITFSSAKTTVNNLNITVESCVLSSFVEALPQDTVVECTHIPDAAVLTAVDSCGNNIPVTFTETNNDDGSCADYTIVRKWTACGPSGNVINHEQTITVRDTTAPYFIQDLPVDLTLECTDTIPDAITLTAADKCDPSVCIVNFEEIISGQDDGCAANYLITRTWKVRDCSGNENVHVQTIAIEDNNAPEFEQDLPENYTVECTSEIPDAETLTAVDACDASLCAVNFNEVIIGKDDGCDANYQVKRIWKTRDCAGNENAHIQIITVEDNTPPSFVQTLPTDAIFECDADIPDAPAITAVDSCDSSVCIVDFNEEIIGQDDDCPATFQIIRTWSTKDCADNTVSHTQTLTFEDNTAPEFVETLPADIAVSCNEIPDAAILTATDNCDTNLDDVVLEETIFNKDDECDNDYEIKRVWKVTDCANNEASHTQRITITGGDPTFIEALPQDIEVTCQEVPTADILTAIDGCGVTLDVNFEETSTSDSTSCGDYVITRIWKATTCNGELMHTQTVTVTEPTISFIETLPVDTTVSCQEIPDAVVLSATNSCGDSVAVIFEETVNGSADNCEPYTISRVWKTEECVDTNIMHTQTITIQPADNASFNETLPTDFTLECEEVPMAATLTAVDSCGNVIDVLFEETSDRTDSCSDYTINRIWTATYCGDKSITHIQTINVTNGESSFNEALPQNAEISCSAIPDPVTLTAVDGCGNAIDVAFEETTDKVDDCSSYVITRTWTAVNCDAQLISHVQLINVTIGETSFNEDLPEDTTIECGDPEEAVTLTAVDGCGNPLEVVFEETSDQDETNDCPLYLITRTWTAVNCDGSELTHTQIISVGDTEAPTLADGNIDDVALLCGEEIPAVSDLMFEDNCTANENLTIEFTENELADNGTITITRTWVVTDSCDNAETFTQKINITEPETQSVTVTNCINDGTIDFMSLFNDNNVTGTWEDLDNSGALTGSEFDTFAIGVGTYRFRLIDDVTNCTTGREVIVELNDDCEVLPCRLEDIEISEVVTPNGDGINEFFVIDGVEGCGFITQVKVFNRLGQLVFESNDYQNDWSGIERGGDQLPSGTYFYIVRLVNSGFGDIQGFIFLGSGA
ncbi:gliding motility-associated C-terminal domain-containing protein [Spongiivirga sp. MCCC 1A20706]|uniref:gliding motility-associated C-terminal domain-containing protein n=1 Tax=Spongiivirga sp. MCCC 1A20706 TaxID=3160963 RepID=UPI003977C5D1